jgi:hypothetical protein
LGQNLNMEKYDYKKSLKAYFTATAEGPTTIMPYAMQFLMTDGAGAPEEQPFQQALPALYGVAYGVKFGRKKDGLGPEFSVQPLEALWWHPKNEPYTGLLDRWMWTLMIGQPDFVTQGDVDKAVAAYAEKHGGTLPTVRLERFNEGPAIQILHIGPYATENQTLRKMEAWMHENGYHMAGKHHEIYLGDPRKTDPADLKTILRYPVERRSSSSRFYP